MAGQGARKAKARTKTRIGLLPSVDSPEPVPSRLKPDKPGAKASRDDRRTGLETRTKTAPLHRRGRAGYAKLESVYICVREPCPLGVVMVSQVPLATYFQAWAS